MATINDLQNLQDGLSASIKSILSSYDATQDPAESATLLNQSHQLAAQMTQIETNLFHQQTIQAGATIDQAFALATGFTAQLTAAAGQLQKISDTIATAAKLIGVVSKIIGYLPL